MKVLYKLILSAFILSSISLHAQEYMPFPRDNAVWYSMYSYSWPSPPYYYYYTYKYETNGDTLINNMNYTKLYWDTDLDYNHYQGAYRVDSANNRVYYLDGQDTSEILLFDFGLVPGDTISIFFPPGSELFKIVCLDTSSMIINGVPHLSLTIYSYFDYGDCITTWVEGIGSLRIPIETRWFCGYTFESEFDLTCFYYKGEEIYHWNANPFFSGCIGSNTEIPEVSYSTIQVVPNPVTGISKILCRGQENSVCDYQIIDITGRIVREENDILLSEITIYHDFFDKGLYLMKIFLPRQDKYVIAKFTID